MSKGTEEKEHDGAREGRAKDAKNLRETVNISELKEFASRLPLGSPLREVLAFEDSELEIPTFLARLPIYLKLSGLQNCRRNRT